MRERQQAQEGNAGQGTAQTEFRPAQVLWASYAALTVVGLIIAMKSYAYYASGASSLLASLVDSAGDAVISLFTYFSLKISLKPADHDHRHGHGKVEGFSALFQSSFLIGGALFVALESARKLMVPTEIQNEWLGIGVSAAAIILTLILVTVQRHIYKLAPSLALKADQKHYISDILLNGAVIIALLSSLWGGFKIIDMIVSLSIAGFMIWSAYQISREAIDMLMDREIDAQDRKKILETVKAHKQVYGIHDLRTRKSGMAIYISFDMELDPELSLKEAHDIAREIDHALLEIFPNAEIIIHKDPKGDTHDPRHKVKGLHH